jgi:hypothetical protein
LSRADTPQIVSVPSVSVCKDLLPIPLPVPQCCTHVVCNSVGYPRHMPDKHPKVGEKIKVNMHGGKIVDATIKAIIESTDGVRYQVDFGHDQTALVHEWQVVTD